eukprot:CAMPEP_0172488738 /NCGR_PEP_ID=MMETSP1066-20121228/18439_1 /TAXON_ID=671091 /ORGANISM="Coscinodiscus wailesii, Strain CCMP2513" /LENGTH=541 /DNA_ID=CAMNT_0013256163 /DNA_START=127 /DNA_END=1752 /DNA_ORIENTATION=+
MTSRHARSININEYSSASVASATRIADRSGDDNIADNAGGDRVDQPVNVAVVETEVVNDAAAVVVSHEDQSDVNSTIAIATATNAFYVSSMPLTANTTIGTRSSENSESNTRPSEPIPYIPYAGNAEAVDVTAEAEEESVVTYTACDVDSDETDEGLPIANPVDTVIPMAYESSVIGVPSSRRQWLCKGKWTKRVSGLVGVGVVCIILIVFLSVGDNGDNGDNAPMDAPPQIARDKSSVPMEEDANESDSGDFAGNIINETLDASTENDIDSSTPFQAGNGMTSSLIKRILIDFYVTKPEDLEDETNDHHKAVEWLTTEDKFKYPIEEELRHKKIIQRFVATLLYFSLKGDIWLNQCGLLNPDLDECLWSVFNDAGDTMGLTCNANGELNAVLLWWMGVSGKIPYEIGNMTALEYFNVIGGTIEGTIPERMSKLEKMTFFMVNHNMLEGTIPRGFVNLNILFAAGFYGNENLHGHNVLCTLVRTESLYYLSADCNVTNPERCECCSDCCDFKRDDRELCCFTERVPEFDGSCYDPTPWIAD